MIKLTDIVYYGNGFVATFDDNSVANTQFKVVDGKLITIGLSPEQKAAVDVFNNTSINTSDPRFQGITATASADLDTYTQTANGVIATNSGPTDVLTLTPGKEYIIFVFLSNAGGANLTTSNVAAGSITLFGFTSTVKFLLSSYTLSYSNQQQAARQLTFLKTGDALNELTQISADDMTDQAIITIRQDGDIEARHVDNGNSTNGAWIIWEKE